MEVLPPFIRRAVVQSKEADRGAVYLDSTLGRARLPEWPCQAQAWS